MHTAVSIASTPSRHPAHVYLAGLRVGSGRRNQQDALTTIAQILAPGSTWDTCPWWEIRYEHAVLIRAALVERYRPATVNRHLAALRRVLKECWKLGLMTGDERELAASVENVENTTLPAGRALDTGEIRSLFTTIAQSGGPAAARDAALFAVLYGGGLRRAEVVALDLADYSPTTGALTIRHAKRQRERVVYATNGGQDALTAWLQVRGDGHADRVRRAATSGPGSRVGQLLATRSTTHLH